MRVRSLPCLEEFMVTCASFCRATAAAAAAAGGGGGGVDALFIML